MAARRVGKDALGDRHGAAFAVGVVLGGAAGTVWALFNAPRSGAETRAELARAVETAVRGVGEAVAVVRERIRERGERAADRLALAFDAVTGGAGEPGALAPTAIRWPEAATASSPSPVAGLEAAAVDPATLAAADVAGDGLAAGGQTPIEPVAGEPASPALLRTSGGPANAIT